MQINYNIQLAIELLNAANSPVCYAPHIVKRHLTPSNSEATTAEQSLRQCLCHTDLAHSVGRAPQTSPQRAGRSLADGRLRNYPPA